VTIIYDEHCQLSEVYLQIQHFGNLLYLHPQVTNFHYTDGCFFLILLTAVKTESTPFDHVKGKGKVVPVLLTKHHAMKVYWGSGQLHAPAALPPGKEPLVPIG
jgi:hypothetical protein